MVGEWQSTQRFEQERAQDDDARCGRDREDETTEEKSGSRRRTLRDGRISGDGDAHGEGGERYCGCDEASGQGVDTEALGPQAASQQAGNHNEAERDDDPRERREEEILDERAGAQAFQWAHHSARSVSWCSSTVSGRRSIVVNTCRIPLTPSLSAQKPRRPIHLDGGRGTPLPGRRSLRQPFVTHRRSSTATGPGGWFPPIP